jgi:predicted transcriptional regulator
VRKGVRRTREFQQMAVDRMRSSESSGALARELGVSRRSLYRWRARRNSAKAEDEVAPPDPREASLGKQVQQLKRLLAEKTLEVDFFQGALQKVEARRQRNGKSGGKASTTKSGT